MAKRKCGSARGNVNTSAFSREAQRKLSTNQQISSYTNTLFATLLAQKQEDFDTAYLDLQARFDTADGKGILRDMARNHHIVNYGTIQMESFSLGELENLKLRNFKASNPAFPLKVEQAIVQYLKTEFSRGLSPEIKSDFEEAIRYHNTNLTDLLATMRNFPDQINDEKQRSVYQKRSQTFILPFSKIIAQLEASGEDMSRFKTQGFTSWTEDQQYFADSFVSKIIVSRLDRRVQEAKNLIFEVKDMFDRVMPPLTLIFQKFPLDIQSLLKKYPDDAQRISLLEEKKLHRQTEFEITDIEQQIHNVYRELYLKDLQTKNPTLAEYLTELKNSDFDFSRLTDQQGFFNLLAELRLQQMENEHLLGFFGADQLSFKDFFTELFDLQKDHLSLNGYQIPVKKRVVAGSHPQLKNFSEWVVFDGLPLEYEIDIGQVPFSIEDRSIFKKLFIDRKNPASPTRYILQGKDIGKLLFLFKMGQENAALFDGYNPEFTKQKLSPFLSSLGQEEKLVKEKQQLHSSPLVAPVSQQTVYSPQSPQEVKDAVEDQLKGFYETWNAIGGMQGSQPDFGFKEGSVLYVSPHESRLPPYEMGSNARVRMEIVGVNADGVPPTFQVKTTGAEMSLPKKEEGKIWTVEMNKENLENLIGKGEKKLMTSAQKVLGESSNFGEQLRAFQQANLCSGEVLGGAEFKNGKFMIQPQKLDGSLGDEEEVTYFGSTDTVPDPKSSKIKTYHVLYKVKHNADHTFSVSSEFVDMNGEAKTHTQKMKYSDFLFFLNEKKLAPKTKSQAEEEKVASSDVLSHHKRKWKLVSFRSFIFGIKNVYKNLNSKLDEYQKEQDQAFLDYLVSDVVIYKVLGNTLGFISPLKDAANRLHEDAMLKKESNVWKSIETWINKFKSMQDYATLFEKGYDRPNGYTLDAIIGKGNTLQKIILSGKSVVDNDGLRPIMAAAMVANLRQGKGLYRGLPGKDNQGLWVKCLLGNEHYSRYMEKRKAVIEKIQNGAKNADQLQDQLKKSEVDYIVNNIRNANGTEGAFGSVDDDNKQILKQLYSDKFAGELESAANEMCGKSAIEGAYGKISHNNFAIASNDFKRFIKSGRIESALGNLKKMGDLAKTAEQHRQLKVAMTYVMISGVMNRYGDKATRKWFDALARTYMIPTAFFAKKWNNQSNAVHLLEQIFPQSDPRNFSRVTGYKNSDFSISSANIPYGKLLDALDVRWRENSSAIDAYFKTLKSKDCSGDPILKDIQEKLWEKNEDNLDGDWAGNSGITGHYAMLASPSTIARNRSYDRSGFTGKDVDEKNDKADFWKAVLGDLKSAANRPNGAEFLLRQFITWFVPSEGDYTEFIRWIRTANSVRNYGIGRSIGFPIRNEETGVSNYFSSQSGYKSKDASDILWYLFKGKVLRGNSALPPNEFEAILDFFHHYFDTHLSEVAQDTILGDVFGKSMLNASDSKPIILIPWEEYNKYVDKNNPLGNATTQKGGTPQEKQERDWKKRNYRSSLFLNERLVALEKEMNRIGISNAPQLSGFDEDFAHALHQEVYGRAS